MREHYVNKSGKYKWNWLVKETFKLPKWTQEELESLRKATAKENIEQYY